MPFIIPSSGGSGDIPEYAVGEDYGVDSIFEWNRTLWRVDVAIINAPAEPSMGSVHAIARVFDQGDNSTGANNTYQMLLGYSNTTTYPSYISTRHWGGSTNSEIRFNVNQGGQTEAFSTAAVNLRIVANGKAYLTNAAGAYVAPDSDTGVATKKYVDTAIGASAWTVCPVSAGLAGWARVRTEENGATARVKYSINKGGSYINNVQIFTVPTGFRSNVSYFAMVGGNKPGQDGSVHRLVIKNSGEATIISGGTTQDVYGDASYSLT